MRAKGDLVGNGLLELLVVETWQGVPSVLDAEVGKTACCERGGTNELTEGKRSV